MKVSLIQTRSTTDKRRNLDQASALMNNALRDQPDLIVLPEMFNLLCSDPEERKKYAEQRGQGETYGFLQQFAKRHQVVIHGGSICETDGRYYYNTSVIFGRDGREIAVYRKIHLFDVTLPNGFVYKESDFYQPGSQLVTYSVDSKTIGCAICFDLRFAVQFRDLAKMGAQVIMAPSAFTHLTGQAHWEILLRARAIETQTFIIAPGQTGEYAYRDEKRQNWGHSMAVDPWGNILGQLGEEVGHLTVELDFNYQQAVRNRIPVLHLI